MTRRWSVRPESLDYSLLTAYMQFCTLFCTVDWSSIYPLRRYHATHAENVWCSRMYSKATEDSSRYSPEDGTIRMRHLPRFSECNLLLDGSPFSRTTSNVRLTTVPSATICELEPVQNNQQNGRRIVDYPHDNYESEALGSYVYLRKLTLLWVKWRTLTRTVFATIFLNIKELGGC